MDGPQARRQRSKLNAFDSATLYERDRVLKVVVCVLSSVGREDSSRRHRLAVDGFDYSHLVWTDFDQREFANDLLERPFDQVKSGLEHVGLDADFAFGCDDATRRHLRAEIAPLFDRDLASTDVDQYSPQNDQQEYERDERDHQVGEQ